jgi:hypothetical protein
MFPDTGIDDVNKQGIAEYAIHIKDPVLSSLKMEGIRLLLLLKAFQTKQVNCSFSTRVVFSLADSPIR